MDYLQRFFFGLESDIVFATKHNVVFLFSKKRHVVSVREENDVYTECRFSYIHLHFCNSKLSNLIIVIYKVEK